MSTVKTINIVHPSGSTTNIVNDSSGNMTVGGTLAMGSSFMRNRIINGAMVIDQRNAGAAVTINTADASYPCDRFQASGTASAGVYTAQQVSDAPTGFTNSVKITTTTASASIGSTADYLFGQKVEGFNFADLQWGTANAKTATLSFWVKSSLTGTFAGVFANSAWNRSYVFNYTISSANTWEQKTITVAGDTTGTWIGATNGIGLRLFFSLGSGSTYLTTANAWTAGLYESTSGAVNVISTLNATWQISGVQLEVGTVATPFEREIYSNTLAKCQRYLPAFNAGGSTNQTICTGASYSTTAASFIYPFKVSARVAPTGISSTAASNFSATNSSGSYVAATGITYGGTSSTESGTFNLTGVSGLVAGGGTFAISSSSTGQILFTGCEL
jgi:hypothetical protein